MHASHRRILVATAALLCASAAAQRPDKPAADACETAVAQTVRDMRGGEAHEIQFGAARRLREPVYGDASHIAGQGQYRGRGRGDAVPFSYRCAYDPDSQTTSGVMFRETGDVPVPERPAWEPDLTTLSPEACEAAAAAALKDKYPAVAAVSFRSDTRQLRPAPDAATSLEGQGRLERVAGMNPAPFSYRCVFDAASGRITGVTTRD